MKAITDRKLPPDVAGNSREKPRKGLHHDLDRFAGKWTRKEADEFDAALKAQRRVDPKGWK